MLRYLVDPIFQVINTAGKPATGGYIEVYLHGTRDKYYCASDFNGTLHPFKIPLDSLGANIILADDANAYDIYVYNRYGSLLMSRYNVAPVQGGGSEGVDRIGKVHFLKAVSDDLADMRAPYSFWIVDLEKPNANSPYGYDYAMADEVIEQLSAGEIFVLSSYGTAPSAEEDIFIMCSSQNQSREGHPALRIWFVRMFASYSPEYMYFTTIYTPSRHNSEGSETVYPEGRMAILNWRGQQDAYSEFRFMEYTELAEVATSGSYDDLNNKPTIPAAQVQSDWSQSDNTQVDYIKNKPILATVATSGSYDDLTNKPSIPAAQEQSDWEQSNSSAVDYIKNKPNLSTVATSGSYNDLNNKPTIPAAPVQSNWDEDDSSSLAYIQNKPNLALKEDASNKAQLIDPMSETEYPSSKAVAGYCNAITTFISHRAVYWNDASSYAGGSTERYFKLATISSEALQNNINNVWRTIVSTDSVIEVAYLRLKVLLNAAGDQPVGNLNVSPIGIWNYAVTFSLVLRGTVGNVTVELWAHHEGSYRSTVISDMGGGSFIITSKDKSDWTYTSYNNDGSASIPTDASTQVINAVVDP